MSFLRLGGSDMPLAVRLQSITGVLVMLIALAFPFFGVINSFLGAGTTTLETYIIPAVAYNWVYWSESAQIACPIPPPWSATYHHCCCIVMITTGSHLFDQLFQSSGHVVFTMSGDLPLGLCPWVIACEQPLYFTT